MARDGVLIVSGLVSACRKDSKLVQHKPAGIDDGVDVVVSGAFTVRLEEIVDEDGGKADRVDAD
jgi:hypothetical protein